MSSFELLELFGVSIDEVVEYDGRKFDPVTLIVTSAGLSTIGTLDDAKSIRTVRADFVDEDGALAGARRGGERPEWKQALVQVANETAVLRAAYAPDADASEYESRLFLPPARQRELNDEAQREADDAKRLRVAEPGGGMSSLWEE